MPCRWRKPRSPWKRGIRIDDKRNTNHFEASVPQEFPPLKGELPRCLGGPPALLTASRSYEHLTHIHPFSDGNGRTARLLMNLSLLRSGYPPVVIEAERRAADIEAPQTLYCRTTPVLENSSWPGASKPVWITTLLCWAGILVTEKKVLGGVNPGRLRYRVKPPLPETYPQARQQRR